MYVTLAILKYFMYELFVKSITSIFENYDLFSNNFRWRIEQHLVFLTMFSMIFCKIFEQSARNFL